MTSKQKRYRRRTIILRIALITTLLSTITLIVISVTLMKLSDINYNIGQSEAKTNSIYYQNYGQTQHDEVYNEYNAKRVALQNSWNPIVSDIANDSENFITARYVVITLIIWILSIWTVYMMKRNPKKKKQSRPVSEQQRSEIRRCV